MEYLALSAGRQSDHEKDENGGQDHQGDRECRHAKHGRGPVVEEVGFSENFQAMVKSVGFIDNDTVITVLIPKCIRLYKNVKNNLSMESLPDEHTPQFFVPHT